MTQMLDLMDKDVEAAIITLLSYVQEDSLVMKSYETSTEPAKKEKKMPEMNILQDKFNWTEITEKRNTDLLDQ